MTPLSTVLICLPAVVALILSVGGLVVLGRRRREPRRPAPASGRPD